MLFQLLHCNKLGSTKPFFISRELGLIEDDKSSNLAGFDLKKGGHIF